MRQYIGVFGYPIKYKNMYLAYACQPAPFHVYKHP